MASHHYDIKQARILEGQVWNLVGRRDMRAALALCQRMNDTFPEFAPGWRTASHLALRVNNPEAALATIEKAIVLEPSNHEWLLQKASCMAKLGKIEALSSLLDHLTTADLENGYQNSTLALLCAHVGRHESALKYYEVAIAKEPNESQHYYNAASSLRFLGRFDKAEKNYNKAIALNPQDYEAYRLRSELRKQTEQSNHVDELSAVVEKTKSDARAQAQLCYTLAKELEDLGESDRAFHYLNCGAKARRSLMKYDPKGDLRTIDAIRETFNVEFMSETHHGSDNAEAIFVLGLPRTGTTLVERIISSHSEVISAGELNNFSLEMMRQLQSLVRGSKPNKEALVGLSATLDFKALGEAYINSTRPTTGATRHFIDKLPLNYLYIGLIHLALPKAKIIQLERHPLDTCYAIYKQLFKDAYPFSYDLEELGHYYLAYRGLMDHWHKVMPGVIHTVRYETLVHDQEGQSRALIDACGLPWQDACLRYYENAQVSTTASAVQVRQPVYTSSVGRWRQYREQLKPLIHLLQEGGVVIPED